MSYDLATDQWYATDALLQPLRQTPAFVSWLEELAHRQHEAEQRYAGTSTYAIGRKV